mgnify:FL=1
MIQRNTIQRSLILEAVNKLKCHATAEEVYQALHGTHPNISKATVYRNLSQLAEAGEIRNLEIPGEAERYDHITTPHNHLKCTKCSRIFDIDIKMDKKTIEKIQSQAEEQNEFEITGHYRIFKGRCPNCK